MSYWFVWPLGIVLWLAVGWAVFAWFESRALKHDARKEQITLSMFCYTVGSKFPLSLFLGGLFVGLFWGILMTHLAWHWCPPGSTSEGMLQLPDIHRVICLDGSQQLKIANLKGVCPL